MAKRPLPCWRRAASRGGHLQSWLDELAPREAFMGRMFLKRFCWYCRMIRHRPRETVRGQAAALPAADRRPHEIKQDAAEPST